MGTALTCNTLLKASSRIFQIPKLGTKLKQDSIPLSYTPRKFITHPTNRYFYMIEGDHRVHGEGAAAKKLEQAVGLSLSEHIYTYLPVFWHSASRARKSITRW
jgi:hypothetical protein